MKNACAKTGVATKGNSAFFRKQTIFMNPAIPLRHKRLSLNGVQGVLESTYQIAFDTTTPKPLPLDVSRETIKDRLEKAISLVSPGLFFHTERSGIIAVTNEDRLRFIRSAQEKQEFAMLTNFLLVANDFKLTNHFLRDMIHAYSEKKHHTTGIMKGDLMIGWNMLQLVRLISMHSLESDDVSGAVSAVKMHNLHDMKMFYALSEVLMQEWLQIGSIMGALYVSHAINVQISIEEMEDALDAACARCNFSQIQWGLEALQRECISRKQTEVMVHCYFTRWVERARLNYVFQFPKGMFMKHMKVSDIKKIMEIAKEKDAINNRNGHFERQFQAILDSKRATVIPISSALVA